MIINELKNKLFQILFIELINNGLCNNKKSYNKTREILEKNIDKYFNEYFIKLEK